MAIRLTEKSPALIELPMLLFLRLADADGKMTAREMARFDALLEKPHWCRSPLLRQALVNTQAQKAALWKENFAPQSTMRRRTSIRFSARRRRRSATISRAICSISATRF